MSQPDKNARNADVSKIFKNLQPGHLSCYGSTIDAASPCSDNRGYVKPLPALSTSKKGFSALYSSGDTIQDTLTVLFGKSLP